MSQQDRAEAIRHWRGGFAPDPLREDDFKAGWQAAEEQGQRTNWKPELQRQLKINDKLRAELEASQARIARLVAWITELESLDPQILSLDSLKPGDLDG